MKCISMVIQLENESLHLGDVLIEGGKCGEVIPQIPIVKHYGEINTHLTKWNIYDYQAFCGLVEVYKDGDVRLYLIDSNEVYKAYKEGSCLCYLVELANEEEYNIFQKNL